MQFVSCQVHKYIIVKHQDKTHGKDVASYFYSIIASVIR